MKIKLLLILISLMPFNSFLLLYGQDEVFPKSDAIWAIHIYERPHDKLFVYGLKGDTLINGKEYQKLYLLNDTIFSTQGKDTYAAGIRQDNKKVWILPSGIRVYGSDIYPQGKPWDEALLYDFSKQKGDNILFNSGIMYMTYVLSSALFNEFSQDTYSLTINNVEETIYGKKYSFTEDRDYPQTSPWIEEIGSLAGLWFPRVAYSSYGPSGCFLRCLKVGGVIKYLDEEFLNWSDCPTCFGNYYDPQSVEEEQNDSNLKILFYPETKILEIVSETEFISASLDIINMEGNTLRTVLLKAQDNKIDLSNLNKGTYIYKLKKEFLSKTGKIVIW